MKVYNEQSDNKLTEQLETKLELIRKNKNFNAKKYIDDKSKILNKYMKKSNLSACVVAVSGGIDSAVVLSLVNYASRQENSPIKKIVPLLLPISNSVGITNQDSATKRGENLCKSLNLHPYIIDLGIINAEITKLVEEKLDITASSWAIGQLGPYSRTPILCYTTSLLTQEGFNAITVGTTNRSEFSYIGYVGKFSDEAVDIQLISDIYKSEVYLVAKELNVIDDIIKATPSGDMYDSRTDEMVFGASYDFLELYLEFLNLSKQEQTEFLKNLDKESLNKFDFYSNNIENLHKYNLHKYLGKSPAIHLDLWNSSTVGGLDNYYEITKRILNDL